MSKLLILKGLPASGKSTYAKELVDKGWKRVNKDDLRAMIDSSKWSRDKEKHITPIERDIVVHYLKDGFNVVVDDTNFGWEDTWKAVAELNYSEFEVKFFDVPVMECVERDAKRGDKSVGAKVIFRMYDQYLKPAPAEIDSMLPDCFIFDIDGTLAKMDGRSPYDYTKVDTDTPNYYVAGLFRLFHKTIDGDPSKKLILVSGRESSCRKATEEWLLENRLFANDLFMREAGDHRDDRIVKKEIYEKYIKDKYNVLGVFDDRDRVVGMWRSLGLTCFQVDYGMF